MIYYCITILQKGVFMTATVRLDEKLEETLENLSNRLHKKKSDVIREAIAFYANNINKSKKNKILLAVKKTKNADKVIYDEMEGTLNDGI
jgi:predicted DNA-binding protein